MDGLGSFEGFRLDRSGLFRLDRTGAAVPVAVSPRSLDLLAFLVRHRGELVSKDAIMKAVWPGMVVGEGNLTVQISALRRILDQNRKQCSCIQTIAGRGYRYVGPATRSETDPHSAILAATEMAARPRPRLSIVVLPFTNLSDDREQQYFADGITEDLTTDLSRIPGMFVISRNTAFTYRDKPIDAKQIGRELGVSYVLEGSARRSGTQVRVNAQLIDAETAAHLWAERFDGDTGDLFALQNEVTSRIAVALNLELIDADRPSIPTRSTTFSADARLLRARQRVKAMRHASACGNARWPSILDRSRRKACWRRRSRPGRSMKWLIRPRPTSRAPKRWWSKLWRRRPAARLRTTPKAMCCGRRADPRRPFPNMRR